MGLSEDFGPGPIALDTSIFIYAIERHPRYLPLVRPLFEEADRGERRIVTSALTLLEVLVVPYRTKDAELAARYEALLTRSRGVRVVPLTTPVLRAAAVLRATTRVKTPDALQLAAASVSGCNAFLTNDRDIPPIPNLRVIDLSSW